MPHLPNPNTDQQALGELAWLLNPQPKRYHVLATAWLTETNGEEVPCTLKYGEFNTIKEARAQIKDLKTDCEVHPYFGRNEIHYSIKDTQPPKDRDIMEMFPELDFGVPKQNILPAKALITSTSLGGQQ